MNAKNRSTESMMSQGQFRIQHVVIICKYLNYVMYAKLCSKQISNCQ